ncbi:MAG: hypothetical protein AAGA54_17710 [Myxococcota bacterium]
MRLRRLALCALLMSPVGLSCKKQQLAAAVVPDEGITMRYDLTPGQSYQGHLKSRTAITTPMGDIVIRFEFDVDLLVTGNSSADGPLVIATFNAIETNVVTPSAIPAAMAGVNPEVAKALNGMEIRFNMNDEGAIENVPELPEGQPPEVVATVGQLTTALQASIIRLPEKPLKKGETWTRERDEDGMKSKSNGTFKDFGTVDGQTVAKLLTETTGDMKREMQGREVTGTLNVLGEHSFVTSAGYPAEVSNKVRQSNNIATINVEIDATWAKGEVRAVETTAPAEVQAVTDPCDADYVGPDPCPADAASEEQAVTDPCDADYVGPDPCPADAAETAE